MTATWQLDSRVFKENVRHVTKGQPVMAVVKNNAYNFGLEFALKAFSEVGVTVFSTTSLEEAIRIRKITPEATIFLMNPSTEFDILKENNIQMTLPSLAFYYKYQKELAGIAVHLEYENLLHRSGFKDFEEMKEVLIENKDVSETEKMLITGIWTHFGYADEFEVSDYEVEKEAWLTGLNEILKSYSFEFIHAQNSASFMRDDLFPQHTHARLGIVLYGSRPYASLSKVSTKQSLKVSANVIQIRQLEKGESAGYSFTFTAEKATKLAVVDIGYGDGILKTRSHHDCLINGNIYPIRGLMMSHLFVEVDERVFPDDEVVLYSEDIRVDDYTFKGVGANSEQLSALNHSTLKKIIF